MKTAAGDDEQLVEAHERLATTIERLVSGEDWQAMLAVAKRFHRYSLNNVLLVQLQRPDATRVAGYRDWQKLKRQVRHGEHAIHILAPIYRPVRGDGDGGATPDGAPSGTPRREPPPADAGSTAKEARPDGARRVLAGFKIVRVFDVSQTVGQPLPEVAPTQLSGDAPDALYDGLAAQVDAAGFALLREDCGRANGETDFLERRVLVRPDLAPAQAAKTLAHELGHVLLHGEDGGLACRGHVEVEAESVAFLVCQHAGLDSGDYSFPYVAGWAKGDAKLVRATGERSIRAARIITGALGLTPAPPERGRSSEAAVARRSSRAPARRTPTHSPTHMPAAERGRTR